jgi:hypothetical protein
MAQLRKIKGVGTSSPFLVETRGSKFGQLTYDSTICGATKLGETHGLLEQPIIRRPQLDLNTTVTDPGW